MSFGKQFDAGRWAEASGNDDVIPHIEEALNAKAVINVEPDETFDTFEDAQHLHQLIDFASCDYVADPLHGPIVGIDHREHNPSDSTLRFDIRSDTGTDVPATLQKIREAVNSMGFAPAYASRLHRGPNGDIRWVRVVDLWPLAVAIENDEIERDGSWQDKMGRSEAWFFTYDQIRDLDALVYEHTNDINHTERNKMANDDTTELTKEEREQIKADPVLELSDFEEEP